MSSIMWKRNNNSRISKINREKKEEKINFLTFGYSCKLFNDDEQAQYLDKGKNLIPWMGDESLLIDRFDVRGYLYPNDLKKYESICDKNYENYFTAEEYEFEQELNKERYKDFFNLENEHEKELKKLSTCLEEDNKKLNQVEFNYDNIEKNKSQFNQDEMKLKVEKNDYIVPKGLKLPNDIQTPNSMKLHNLIEKTAKFISKHGIQMEILLKIKQTSNVHFDFLNYDSPLNKYYKYLIEAFKNGIYQIQNTINNYEENLNSNENLEESDNEDYLHPSLSSSKKLNLSVNLNKHIPTFTPKINEQSLYSKLAKNLKEKIIVNEVYNKSKIIEAKEIKYNENQLNNTIKKEETKLSLASLLPEIPTEIKIIIEKLAQYVTRNGEEFEKIVKNRNEERFSFLNPGHKFHFHYVKTKLKLLEEKKINEIKLKEKIKQLNLDQKPTTQVTTNQNKNEIVLIKSNNLSVDEKEKIEKERLLKEKQKERRRKAAIFLTSLKNLKNKSELFTNSEDQPACESVVFKPESTPKEKQSLERIRDTPSPLVQKFNDLDTQQKSNHLTFSLIKKNKYNLDENINENSNNLKKKSRISKNISQRRSLSLSSDDNNYITHRSQDKKDKELRHRYKSNYYRKNYSSRSRSNSRHRNSRSHSRLNRSSESPKIKSNRLSKNRSNRLFKTRSSRSPKIRSSKSRFRRKSSSSSSSESLYKDLKSEYISKYKRRTKSRSRS